MKRWACILGLCIWAVATATGQEAETPAAPEASPEVDNKPIERLEELLDNEEQAVEALRQFHLAQLALIEWDMTLKEERLGQNESELAEELQERAAERVATVEKAYKLVLERYPENPKLLNYYGELLYDIFHHEEEAVQKWEQAQQLDKSLSAPLNNLAIHYCHGGEYERGLRYFERALKLQPNNPDYLYNFSQIMLVHTPQVQEYFGWSKSEVFNRAMDMSDKAAELLPTDYQVLKDHAINYFVAERYDIQVDWERAARAWQTAREHAPNEGELFLNWLNEGISWQRAGALNKAAGCFREALSIHPDSDRAQRYLDEVEEDMQEDSQGTPS